MKIHRIGVWVAALALAVSQLAAPVAARADDSRDKKNVAIVLGVAAGALLLTQHDKTSGILAGVGAALLYNQARDGNDRAGQWDNRDNRQQYRNDGNRFDWQRSGGQYNGNAYQQPYGRQDDSSRNRDDRNSGQSRRSGDQQRGHGR